MKYSFTYYWNSQEDENGRLIGLMDGFQNGHRLDIAYRGWVESKMPINDPAELFHLANQLFVMFNDDCQRPKGYRGPSMSIGSVVEIQGQLFSCEKLDFSPAAIWKSEIRDGNPNWLV